MAKNRATPTPPPVEGPLTIEKIAAIHGVSVRTVQPWARAGNLGDSIGTASSSSGHGRPQKAFSDWDVLNHGMRTGRLDEQWRRLDENGELAGSRKFKPGYTIRPNPTRDLDGQVYYFVPHVAQLFGVTTRAVGIWSQRPATKWPAPDLYLEGKPVWFESTVKKWGKATGRLDDEGNAVILRSAPRTTEP